MVRIGGISGYEATVTSLSVLGTSSYSLAKSDSRTFIGGGGGGGGGVSLSEQFHRATVHGNEASTNQLKP